jgi:hypothetical protein
MIHWKIKFVLAASVLTTIAAAGGLLGLSIGPLGCSF